MIGEVSYSSSIMDKEHICFWIATFAFDSEETDSSLAFDGITNGTLCISPTCVFTVGFKQLMI